MKREKIEKTEPQLSGGKIILYLILLIIVSLIIINFIFPSLGVGGCIAIIKINGAISSEKGFGVVSSSQIIELLDEAEKRPDVKGIILEINSGGGSAFASKEIYKKLKTIRKPTLSYIKDIGASGAYLVAIGSKEVFADSTSLTGSIGARATLIDVSKTLEKIGVNITTIKSGEMKDITDIFRPATEKEKELIQKIIDEIFEEFKETVIKERSGKNRFSVENLNKVLDGRIITGKEAYSLGLIDNITTRFEAIDYMGEKTGLGKNPQICVIEPRRDIFSLITEFANSIQSMKNEVKIEYS